MSSSTAESHPHKPGSQLSLQTKLKLYQACVLSTLPCGGETWTTYARQQTTEKAECLPYEMSAQDSEHYAEG